MIDHLDYLSLYVVSHNKLPMDVHLVKCILLLIWHKFPFYSHLSLDNHLLIDCHIDFPIPQMETLQLENLGIHHHQNYFRNPINLKSLEPLVFITFSIIIFIHLLLLFKLWDALIRFKQIWKLKIITIKKHFIFLFQYIWFYERAFRNFTSLKKYVRFCCFFILYWHN